MPRPSARKDALRDVQECMKFAILFSAVLESDSDCDLESFVDLDDDGGDMEIDTGLGSIDGQPDVTHRCRQDDSRTSFPLDRFEACPLGIFDRFEPVPFDSFSNEGLYLPPLDRFDRFESTPFDNLAFERFDGVTDHQLPMAGSEQQAYDSISDFESFFFSSSESDSDSDGDDMMTIIACTHNAILDARYILERTRVPKSTEFRYTYFHCLPSDDFRVITRLSKEIFEYVVRLIEDDPIFINKSPFEQAPVHWQVACALDRLGNDGQGVSFARSKMIWGLGHGTVLLYYKRVVFALCNMRNTFISWPDTEERGRISSEMESFGFKGAVGFVDGSTLPLHVKPTLHGNSYFDRKKQYSIHAQVVCDNKYVIRHLQTGMPGSCHDSGVFSHSPLVCSPQRFFSVGEYLLSDSAYAATPHVVPAYRIGALDLVDDPEEQQNVERFNTFLSRARVVNEHTIGILKSRWTSLRGLRTLLRKQGDIIKVIRHVVACVILHNIAMERDPWDIDEESVEDSQADVDEVIPQVLEPGRRRINAGQEKRLAVRRACLDYHNRRGNVQADM